MKNPSFLGFCIWGELEVPGRPGVSATRRLAEIRHYFPVDEGRAARYDAATWKSR